MQGSRVMLAYTVGGTAVSLGCLILFVLDDSPVRVLFLLAGIGSVIITIIFGRSTAILRERERVSTTDLHDGSDG